MSDPQRQPEPPYTESAFIGGGEMGKFVRAKDWSRTPLGPIESWPPSLRTAVSLAPNLKRSVPTLVRCASSFAHFHR